MYFRAPRVYLQRNTRLPAAALGEILRLRHSWRLPRGSAPVEDAFDGQFAAASIPFHSLAQGMSRPVDIRRHGLAPATEDGRSRPHTCVRADSHIALLPTTRGGI